MARRSSKAHREPPQTTPAKAGGRGLVAGIFAGLVGGLVLAAVLYWYLVAQPDGFKIVEQAPELTPPAAQVQAPVAPPTQPPSQPEETKEPSGDAPAAAEKPDYSFYDILPGKATPKPASPDPAREVYWLQVAALKNAEEADRLKASLSLLNLNVSIQRFQGAEGVLHRVRVGPFNSEDEGMNALDTLAVNDFEPRWVKEPVHP